MPNSGSLARAAEEILNGRRALGVWVGQPTTALPVLATRNGVDGGVLFLARTGLSEMPFWCWRAELREDGWRAQELYEGLWPAQTCDRPEDLGESSGLLVVEVLSESGGDRDLTIAVAILIADRRVSRVRAELNNTVNLFEVSEATGATLVLVADSAPPHKLVLTAISHDDRKLSPVTALIGPGFW